MARRLPGKARSRLVDLRHAIRQARLRQTQPVCPKRIGQDDLRAGINVVPGHLGHFLRVGQIPGVGKFADRQTARL